tara:strand:- start:729 stop:1874 length:1146 start_codon:yes stop_codon:yes gene_type:complete
MSLTWAPGAYLQRNKAHARVMKMEKSNAILPEQQVLFNKASEREHNRRALRIRMERLSKEISKEKVAILDTTQKVIKAKAIRLDKTRRRELRQKKLKQLQFRPTTSAAGSLASTSRSDYSISTSRLGVSMSRPETGSNGPLLSSTSSSLITSRSMKKQRSRQSKSKRDSQRRTESRGSQRSQRSQRSQGSGTHRSSSASSIASSIVSDQWLAEGNDNQAPFTARRHRLREAGMNYVPMDFGGHADLLRSSDGPARVAKYFGRRRKDLELKLKQAQSSHMPAFARKQTDISRTVEKQAACSSLKFMDGPAAGDIVRTRVPISDVTSFVNFMVNGTPFTRPLGEQHHHKMTNLVRERQVLHENLQAMGDSSIDRTAGLFGTWM